MKTATVKELKTELNDCSHKELLELCLRLSKFKKENKELLTYLLFEVFNEEEFINGIKTEIDQHFEEINRDSYYYIRKSVRKILRLIKKHIRYSQNKETEIELLLYFCFKLKKFKPSIHHNTTLINIFNRQIDFIKKKTVVLHEDLQFDIHIEIKELEN